MTTYTLHRLADGSNTNGPVILIPGVGTGAAVFSPPGQVGLPAVLQSARYDVWLLDWRPAGSMPWTVADVAAEDIPQAIERVAAVTHRPVKIIAHCIGAISTMLAAIAGRIPQATTILTNAVSLHPVIPPCSYIRMQALLPIADAFPAFLDPQWGRGTGGFWPTAFRLSARLGLRGCPDPTCKLIRWLYGDVWEHRNVTPATHDWLVRQFHAVPVTFFQHLGPSIRQGYMPISGPRTKARCVFFTGMANHCFSPVSQMRSFNWIREWSDRKDHTVHLLSNYGHLDVFVGKDAARDVFPLILQELDT